MRSKVLFNVFGVFASSGRVFGLFDTREAAEEALRIAYTWAQGENTPRLIELPVYDRCGIHERVPA